MFCAQTKQPADNWPARQMSRRVVAVLLLPRLLLAVSEAEGELHYRHQARPHREREGLVQGRGDDVHELAPDDVAARERRDPEVLVERPVRDTDVQVHEEELRRAVTHPLHALATDQCLLHLWSSGWGWVSPSPSPRVWLYGRG